MFNLAYAISQTLIYKIKNKLKFMLCLWSSDHFLASDNKLTIPDDLIDLYNIISKQCTDAPLKLLEFNLKLI